MRAAAVVVWGAFFAFVVSLLAVSYAYAQPVRGPGAPPGMHGGIQFTGGYGCNPAASSMEDFAGGTYCIGTQPYFSFLSMPGASYTGGPSTAVNNFGSIFSFAANNPAITNAGYQSWEARTNIQPWSEAIAAQWTATFIAIAPTTAVSAPDGSFNAASITDDGTLNPHSISAPGVTYTTGTVMYDSVFVKAGLGGQFIQIHTSNGGFANGKFANFDLINGVVGSQSGMTATGLISYGNGWYRCWAQATTNTSGASTGTTVSMIPLATSPNLPTYQGTGAIDYVWGGQLEAGASLGPYIQTLATPATRPADVAKITAGATFGTTIIAEFSFSAVETGIEQEVAAWDDGTSNNYILFYKSATDGLLHLSGEVGGVGVSGQLNLGAPTAGTIYRVAARVLPGDIAASINGAAVVTSAWASLPTTSVRNFGMWRSNNDQLLGVVGKVIEFPTARTNAQLQAISVVGAPISANDNLAIPAPLRRVFFSPQEEAA